MPDARWLRPLAVAGLAAGLAFTGPASAHAAESIIIDFIRHGEAGDNLVINNAVPGPGLTPAGWQQAEQIAGLLQDHGIDGIFASGMTRAQETAAPAAQLLGLPVAGMLPGLNEIDAGIFANLPVKVGGLPVGAVAYALAPFAWTLGLYSVPQLGSTDLTGMAFQDRFSDAVQAVYDSGDGHVAVFSHEAAIAMWALMNADNPDFLLMAQLALTSGELLPYGGVVEMAGNPLDGWTLVSWAGHDVARATLPVELFVDARAVLTAPQMAGYHLAESLVTGDPAAILRTLQDGIDQIGAALVRFPFAAGTDLLDTLLVPGQLAGDLSILSGQLGGLLGAVLTML